MQLTANCRLFPQKYSIFALSFIYSKAIHIFVYGSTTSASVRTTHTNSYGWLLVIYCEHNSQVLSFRQTNTRWSVWNILWEKSRYEPRDCSSVPSFCMSVPCLTNCLLDTDNLISRFWSDYTKRIFVFSLREFPLSL